MSHKKETNLPRLTCKEVVDVLLYGRIPAFMLERGCPQGFGWTALGKGKDDRENVYDHRGGNCGVDNGSAPTGLFANDAQLENSNGRFGSTKQQDSWRLHNPRPLECFEDLLWREICDMSRSPDTCHVRNETGGQDK